MARVWFGMTALVVLVGLVVQAMVTARATGGVFPTAGGRLVNLLFFFTIDSNVIVGVTSMLLALRPQRTSTLFRVLRLDGIVAIAVTFVVFHVALAGLQELSGSAAVADALLHTASPVLCVLGWLLFGPHQRGGSRLVALSLIFPLCYIAVTLVRGPIVDFYPYPFLDVRMHGYLSVLVNAVVVGVLFLCLAAGVTALDNWLVRRRTATGARQLSG
ncbi:MAG TPA: Pr6Pr family membrane protein [Pseudonocardiaceae bacterium]